jgi:hydrogenase-4 component E
VTFTPIEFLVIGAAIMGVLMVGSGHIRVNLFYYSIQTLLIAIATIFAGYVRSENPLYIVGISIALLKAVGIPIFLGRIIDRIKISSDTGMLVPAPLAMHFSIAMMGIAYLCTQELPVPPDGSRGWPGATAAISLVLTGLVLMLTRRVALSEIVGFLVIENGIYTFALIQTRHMPMIIEM